MAYAEHGATADPSPVAGLPWVKTIPQYSAGTIGARKVSLGVPFYTMRWEAVDSPPGTPQVPPARKWRGRSARYGDAAAAMQTSEPLWDENESSPHLSFDNAGRRTELWFENARSLQASDAPGARFRLHRHLRLGDRAGRPRVLGFARRLAGPPSAQSAARRPIAGTVEARRPPVGEAPIVEAFRDSATARSPSPL